MNKFFWKDRKVFITGHTGFKGGWISLWLNSMGAKIYGYAREPNTNPNFFSVANLSSIFEESFLGEINDIENLSESLNKCKPSIIFHMAAQPIVKDSYLHPVETYETNVMGTVNILEAARNSESVKVIINITSDKCYENKEWIWPYRENDRLGGKDPYSNSKACAELITNSYKLSFLDQKGIGIASVRAGNVIGGGDWSKDRLIPDFFRALKNSEILNIRSPNSIRPWQYVLEPISGYILLAEKLTNNISTYSGGWNFGPKSSDFWPVSAVIKFLAKKEDKLKWHFNEKVEFHEARILKLDSTKAREELNWKSKWNVEKALLKTLQWHEAFEKEYDMKKFSLKQIEDYLD